MFSPMMDAVQDLYIYIYLPHSQVSHHIVRNQDEHL